MEAQAVEHEWESPEGYTAKDWPPFDVESAMMDDIEGRLTR